VIASWSSVFALVSIADLALSYYLLKQNIPGFREVNPFINQTTFSQNLLPQALFVLIICSATYWAILTQTKKYLESGEFIRIRFRAIPGERSIDLSYAVLLFCFILLLSRLLTVAHLCFIAAFGVGLLPGLSQLDTLIQNVNYMPQNVADFIHTVALHFIALIVVGPASIFLVRMTIRKASHLLKTQ